LECKYRVVFIPKFRRRVLYEQLRNHLGELFRKLATQKQSGIGERFEAGLCADDDFDPTQVRGFSGDQLC